MLTRRGFLKTASSATVMTAMASFSEGGISRILAATRGVTDSPEAIAKDETFWREIQQGFTVDRSLINLNNGGVSPSPRVVHEALARHLAYSNEAPVHTMWRVLEPQIETVRQRLARHFGCDAEELAITRNASESLEICIFGLDLKAGDEVLTTNQDYPRMLNSWRQRV